jgi:hypothetical protein
VRNTGSYTEPDDFQPARRLSLNQIAPESLPLIAGSSRHGSKKLTARKRLECRDGF